MKESESPQQLNKVKMSSLQLLKHAQFHGANQLGDKASRYIWAPTLLILLGPAIALVVLTVNRYLDRPTFMVRHDKFLEKRDFPSVVVCPEVNFVEQKMDNFLAKLNYPPGINATIARRILPQLSAFYSLDVLYQLSDLMRVEHLLDYNGITVETAGRLLTATCEETLIKCRWNRRLVNCSDLFEMEFTGDGFCCVFNGRSLRREMENHGLNIKQTLSRRKWYTKLFGYTSGLMLAINQSQTLTSVDLSYKWVALQTGNHFVDTTMNGTAVSPGSEHWIAYYTTGYQIALGAKTLHPSLRKCNMASEKLKYFPKYSQKYCTLEKEIANTLDKCNCVRSNHPKPPGTMRCRAAMLRCATQAMVAFDALSTDCPMTCDTKKATMKASRFVLDETVSTVEPFYSARWDVQRVLRMQCADIVSITANHLACTLQTMSKILEFHQVEL
ncbi:unnamed protein product [Spodoptera littoralis]|uniref:Uncharacterized protein n=1 Tax=Spodoptera littoralis TaxID=7109 RepID=A0A9P0HV62_SPOLI|nr:unnamed protein product [Spodoptera littoralis]CAH1634976.1 unnamed protein product [Spodoptera littoralis]